jgi:hypothetical protein
MLKYSAMKEFIYLFPIPEYTDVTCNPTRPDREQYETVLNEAIDKRYRQQGFGINYVIFDGHAITDAVKIQSTDRIIEVGMDFKTHTTKKPDGTYEYPDFASILALLGNPEVVRIAGFHLWSCVEELAKRAYEQGSDVLVDEDLTEILPGVMIKPEFKADRYPTFNPRALGNSWFEMILESRQDKPWLWQDY